MIRLIRLRRTIGLAMGIAGLACSGFGQTQSGQSGGAATAAPAAPTTSGGGASSRPGRTPTPSPTQPTTTTVPDQQMMIFLSGKVMLDSGTAPGESVTIERVCNGYPRAEAYTDTKGHFSFQLGANNNGVLQDASIGSDRGLGGFNSLSSASSSNSSFGSSSISERDLMGCEIRASLTGYRSDVVHLGGRRSLDNPDLGTIVLHRLANVEGVSISASSLRAPKDAKKAFDKGHDLLKKQKTADARKELEKAVEIYPGYATAWFDLGRAKELQNDTDGARKAYEQALASDPKYLFPYRQLLTIAVKQQNWQETADTSGKLVKLDPVDFPEAHYYNAVSNFYLKNYDAAEKSVREAQKLEGGKRMPKSSQLLGAILIEKRDYAGAAEQIRKFLSLIPPDAPEADYAKKQLVELEKVAGTSKTTPEP